MKKQFIEKVINFGTIDTKTYRYRYDYNDGKVYRIELSKLDTTAAYTDWKEV